MNVYECPACVDGYICRHAPGCVLDEVIAQAQTPRTALILCQRAPVKTNPVPAVRVYEDAFWPKDDVWKCGYCGRRVKVVA